MTVAQALSELLYEHDAVTVPGLGTFSCDYEGAKVNVITNQFERPSATVVFDGQQREENDLLVRHLVASEDLTEDEARQQVNRFVADCFAELKAGREVTLPGIGVLRPDPVLAVGFTAVASNYNGDAFGLSDFHPEPVYGGNQEVDWRAQVARQLKDQNTPMTVDHKAVHDDFGDEQAFERHRRRRVFYGVLMALLLIPAVVMLLYFLEVIHFDLPIRPKPQAPQPVAHHVPVPDSAMQALLVRYDWRPAVAEGEAQAFAATDTLTEGAVADTVVAATLDTLASDQASAQPSAPERIDTPEAQPSGKPAEPQSATTAPTTNQPTALVKTPRGTEILPIAEMQPFAIIAGCFSQQANAEHYLEPIREQGYPGAFLMSKNGMYYVCYGQYATLEEAKAALTDIWADANKKAWILTK
jgi:nucleoid DNA-binding protein/cell division septation protein DedD